MARVCQYSGKKTTVGRSYARRGLAKSKGGVGKKITGKTKRTLQAQRAEGPRGRERPGGAGEASPPSTSAAGRW